MPNATDYWLQGMQVANADQRDYLNNQQKNRDYAAKNKVYYGEDWRGDEKGDTDFGASEAARSARASRDAKAAAQVYLNGYDSPEAVSDLNHVGDLGVPGATPVNPEVLPNATRMAPVQNNLGAPAAVPATPVRVIDEPKLVNDDSADGDFGNWSEVMASLNPQVQPDEPRYIPVQEAMGSPAAAPAVSVQAPVMASDFGQSAIPAAPTVARSPVPNTSRFGAPETLPTFKQIYDRVKPEIRDNPAFLSTLMGYEKDRLSQVGKAAQAEDVAKIRAQVIQESNAIRREALEFKKNQESQRFNVSLNPDGSVAAAEVKLPNGSVLGHMVPGGNGLPKFERLGKLDKAVTEPALSRYIKAGEGALALTGDAALTEEERAQTIANITSARATRDTIINPDAPKVVPIVTKGWFGSTTNWGPARVDSNSKDSPVVKTTRTKEEIVKEYKANPTASNWDKAKAELQELETK